MRTEAARKRNRTHTQTHFLWPPRLESPPHSAPLRFRFAPHRAGEGVGRWSRFGEGREERTREVEGIFECP